MAEPLAAPAPDPRAEAAAFVEALTDAWANQLRLKKSRRPERQTPRAYVYASGWRHCGRWAALDLTHPEDDEEYSVDAMARMERGDAIEEQKITVLRRLQEECKFNFKVVEGQVRFEVRDAGELVIVGKVDGRLALGGSRNRPVFEVKSGMSYQRAESVEDLLAGFWSAAAVYQLLAYLYATGEPWGLFLIDKPGMPALIPVVLEDHLEKAQAFLDQAVAAVAFRFERGPEPAMTTDRTVCARCPHRGKSCFPVMEAGEGLRFVVDEELVAAAKTWLADKEAAERWTAAKKLLGGELRGVESALVGGEMVWTGKWKPSTVLPKELPEPTKRLVEALQEEVDLLLAPLKKKDPKHGFSFTLASFTPPAAPLEGNPAEVPGEPAS